MGVRPAVPARSPLPPRFRRARGANPRVAGLQGCQRTSPILANQRRIRSTTPSKICSQSERRQACQKGGQGFAVRPRWTHVAQSRPYRTACRRSCFTVGGIIHANNTRAPSARLTTASLVGALSPVLEPRARWLTNCIFELNEGGTLPCCRSAHLLLSTRRDHCRWRAKVRNPLIGAHTLIATAAASRPDRRCYSAEMKSLRNPGTSTQQPWPAGERAA